MIVVMIIVGIISALAIVAVFMQGAEIGKINSNLRAMQGWFEKMEDSCCCESNDSSDDCDHEMDVQAHDNAAEKIAYLEDEVNNLKVQLDALTESVAAVVKQRVEKSTKVKKTNTKSSKKKA